jgi:hypothetical protein
MGKRPLDQFAALLQQLLAIVAFDPPPIRVHRFLLICLPLPIALRSFRFRYIAACLGLLNRQYRLIAVVSLVGYHLRKSIQAHLRLLFRRFLCLPLDQLRQILCRFGQRFLNRRCITLMARVHCDRNHRPGFHVHRVLGFKGYMRAAVLHLRDPRIRITRTHPVLIRSFLLSFPIQP